MDYFNDIIKQIHEKRGEILLSKISTFIPSKGHYRNKEYKKDQEGNLIYIERYPDNPKDLDIIYDGYKLPDYEMYKRGYIDIDT